MFDQDIIFRRHAEEKLDPKEQPKITETKKDKSRSSGFYPSPIWPCYKEK